MRILIFSRYGPLGATTRYRFLQYVPALERAGHQIVLRALLEDPDLIQLYTKGRRSPWGILKGYARRWADLLTLNDFDAVICEQEVFPFLPASVEGTLERRHPRFILDYDDAAYVKYERWPVLRRKIPQLMASAETVVVGNGYLADYARRFNPNVHVIPTVVDLASYPVKKDCSARNGPRVVWIGTPVTAPFLKPLIPAFNRLQKKYPKVSFSFIGAGRGVSLDGLRAEMPDWSEETEKRLLSECEIGIMPLPDTDFARGKCGLKLIQYMACGLPVVASPVGANQEIVKENETGFFAPDCDGWFEKLSLLAQNPELRTRLGQNGRARVAQHYSLEVGFSRWLQVLNASSATELAPCKRAGNRAQREVIWRR